MNDRLAEGPTVGKVGPTQRTLTKVNHKVTQRTKLIHDLPQTRCVLRCRTKSSCSERGDMRVCSVLGTDLYFQLHQARRRYTRLLTGALVLGKTTVCRNCDYDRFRLATRKEITLLESAAADGR
jgi:hypothetical protein